MRRKETRLKSSCWPFFLRDTTREGSSFAYFCFPFEASIFCLISLLRKTKKGHWLRRENRSMRSCCLPHGFFLRVVSLKKKGQQEDFNRVSFLIIEGTPRVVIFSFVCFPFFLRVFFQGLFKKEKKGY